MSAAQTAQDLTVLAQSQTGVDRGRLILAIVDLCAQSQSDARTPGVRSLLDPIFMNLVADAEAQIRQRLAEKLAPFDWSPPKLINLLARDDIEIARPVIAASPVLQDEDLARLVLDTATEHRIEIARRPNVGPATVATILGQAEPEVLTALAGNDTAEVSPEGMTQLVEASRRIAGMRSPLARHPRLTTEMAEQLYGWVGQVLRAAIVSRFRVDAAALDAALAEAVRDSWRGAPSEPVDPEQEQMERRLIAKLHMAGQLRTSYLLRALRERRLSLFETALATLGGYSLAAVRDAINADRPEKLALACAGVGVDRVVFGTILTLVRDLNRGRPSGDAERARRAFDGQGPEHADLAAQAFRKTAE
ncbi:MAG TPA: DUF2336 domain-containing protein [Caulobacteraceae bacterium]|jgi:uncharacterized protein (DUF2336 family)|nr:DUF2336 domain-containing protein [Caulobacteraceae bacterium]